MLGRAAYNTPDILAEVDARIYGAAPQPFDPAALIETMAHHAERHIAAGGKLAQVTRHMVGLFHGRKGARRYRQVLSTEATRPAAGPDVLRKAFACVDLAEQRDAA
jgi:tRNA-dihydrouridine synthase A